MFPAAPVGFRIFGALAKLFKKWIASDHPSVTYVGGAVMVLGWMLVIGIGGYVVSLIFGN